MKKTKRTPLVITEQLGGIDRETLHQTGVILTALILILVAVSLRFPIVLVVSWVLILICTLALAVLVYRWFHTGKFGASVLEIPDGRAALGETLRGDVRTGMTVEQNPAAKFTITLTCSETRTIKRPNRRQDGSGSTRETDRIWHHESIVTGIPDAGTPGLVAPVSVALPRNGKPTAPKGTRSKVIWKLCITAWTTGLDYSAEFILPVTGPR